MDLYTPIQKLNGIGKSRAEKLAHLGIFTLRDLLYHFPRAYEKRGDIAKIQGCVSGEVASLILTVATPVSNARLKNRMTLSKFRAFDESGALEVVFFNSPFVKQVFHVGDTFRFYGKIEVNRGRIQLISPKYELVDGNTPLADFVPVYPLCEGLSSKILGKLISEAMDAALGAIEDFMPEHLRLDASLPALSYAIRQAHFPDSAQKLSLALRRLAFDEMFLFALATQKSAIKSKEGSAPRMSPCSIKDYLALLPYELTNAQKRSVNEIYHDLTRSVDGKTPPMTRILVGDVGSGKTVCAALSILVVLKSGYQCGLMAPTEILARQHYADLQKTMQALGFRVALLLGSTKPKEKGKIYEELASGKIQLVIGTHALLSEKVTFQRLGLVITDEQHRFGVMQRAALKDKAKDTHLLVMSATPIPRTLALAMYGDIDVSRIDEMPKGRQLVDTFKVDENYRERLRAFMRKQVEEGGQVYVVCPAIEQKEEEIDNLYLLDSLDAYEMLPESKLVLKDAVSYTEELKRSLPDLRIETLHGKMSGAQKDEIMLRFASGEVDILVSTTVIEVGINVPTATLMVVENAERFGLSQLHQLRGRVGRSDKKSYCVLVSDDKGEKAKRRLDTMCRLHDGFQIAEEDLLMRGPGDFFSNQTDSFRQSGGFQFKFASLCEDATLLSKSFEMAKQLLSADKTLSLPEHRPLAKELSAILKDNTSTIS